MHLFFLILIGCFFIFLFSLFLLSRDDFVIVRRDISLNEIFNTAFLTAMVSLFSARLFYVFFHPSGTFLNPLVFLLFPYFPGLSAVGGIIGSLIFLNFYSRKHKMPLGRVADFFAVSFLTSVPLGLLGYMATGGGITKENTIELILFVILLLIVLFIFPRIYKLNIKDGSSALTIILFTFIIFLAHSFISDSQSRQTFLNSQNIILIVSIFFSIGALLKREGAARLFKKIV